MNHVTKDNITDFCREGLQEVNGVRKLGRSRVDLQYFDESRNESAYFGFRYKKKKELWVGSSNYVNSDLWKNYFVKYPIGQLVLVRQEYDGYDIYLDTIDVVSLKSHFKDASIMIDMYYCSEDVENALPDMKETSQQMEWYSNGLRENVMLKTEFEFSIESKNEGQYVITSDGSNIVEDYFYFSINDEGQILSMNINNPYHFQSIQSFFKFFDVTIDPDHPSTDFYFTPEKHITNYEETISEIKKLLDSLNLEYKSHYCMYVNIHL